MKFLALALIAFVAVEGRRRVANQDLASTVAALEAYGASMGIDVAAARQQLCASGLTAACEKKHMKHFSHRRVHNQEIDIAGTVAALEAAAAQYGIDVESARADLCNAGVALACQKKAAMKKVHHRRMHNQEIPDFATAIATLQAFAAEQGLDVAAAQAELCNQGVTLACQRRHNQGYDLSALSDIDLSGLDLPFDISDLQIPDDIDVDAIIQQIEENLPEGLPLRRHANQEDFDISALIMQAEQAAAEYGIDVASAQAELCNQGVALACSARRSHNQIPDLSGAIAQLEAFAEAQGIDVASARAELCNQGVALACGKKVMKHHRMRNQIPDLDTLVAQASAAAAEAGFDVEAAKAELCNQGVELACSRRRMNHHKARRVRIHNQVDLAAAAAQLEAAAAEYGVDVESAKQQLCAAGIAAACDGKRMHHSRRANQELPDLATVIAQLEAFAAANDLDVDAARAQLCENGVALAC